MTYSNENTTMADSIPEMDRSFVNDPICVDAPQPCEYRTVAQTSGDTTAGRRLTFGCREAQSSMIDSGIGHSDSVNTLCQKLDSIGMQDDIRERGDINDSHQCIEASETDGPSSQSIDSITVFSQDKDGDTLLHTGIILQEQTLVMLFISMAPSYMWLSIKNFLSQTPLILAVLTRQVEVVRRLIVGGADITLRDREGNTALHIACREGYSDVVRTLLDPVRYIETKKNKYEIPYQKVPQNLEIVNYEGYTCLHLAAANGHLDIVELLLNAGADVNAKEAKTGRTVLHNSCIEGNLVLVRFLLKCRNCNINARTYDDFTPFDLARVREHNDVIIELATTGARYDINGFMD